MRESDPKFTETTCQACGGRVYQDRDNRIRPHTRVTNYVPEPCPGSIWRKR